MLDSILSVLPPLATGMLLIITTVLKKGQICPGQRGRIHKVLPVPAIIWLLAAIKLPFVLVNVLLIGFFIWKVKMGKSRKSGPLMALYLANVISVCIIIYQMVLAQGWVASGFVLLETLMLGLIGAHWMLAFANSRLQAFHKLLPVSGIFLAMAVAMILVPFAFSINEETLQQYMGTIFFNFAVLMIATVVWCWHLITTRKIHKVQISVASVLMLISVIGFHQMYF
ncbi:hypothetical protein [Vibrio salinus]|uniref:hypothetical protein n=1 Tax=Vibrio salinus TaxID=2899784 RepID=UPI001E419F5B|nr:hypothetical protein [Vibrio salinus]MCE0492726.1 hypothetical protein [Vibrio salinus]